MSKEKKLYPYRLRYVDRYHTMPDMDLLVVAHNKSEAEEKGYEEICKLAMHDLSLITEGSVSLSNDVLLLSPRYFSTLVYGSWALVECEKQVNVSKHETKTSVDAIHKAADKRRNADGSKRRWSAAEKAARKAKNAGLVLVA